MILHYFWPTNIIGPVGSYYISVSHIQEFEEIPAALSIRPLMEEYQKMERIVLISAKCYIAVLFIECFKKLFSNFLGNSRFSMHLRKMLYVVISENVCTFGHLLGSNFSSESTFLIMNSAAMAKKVYVFGPAIHVPVLE